MVARRSVLKGAAGLSLAGLLADPDAVRAAARSLNTVTMTMPPDDERVRAEMAVPRTTPAPAVLLIHEWWGLNDQIRAVAADLADAGYVALAVDLFDGQVAQTPDEARAVVDAVDEQQATRILAFWIGWLKEVGLTTGRVATLGWCFGGGWSLRAALAAPVDAAVVYYGRVPDNPTQLRRLDGPVLGHFATQDRWINRSMVESFTAAMREADQPYEVYWYDADHAFANPTGGNYDRADARLAWDRTMAFLDTHLRGAP